MPIPKDTKKKAQIGAREVNRQYAENRTQGHHRI